MASPSQYEQAKSLACWGPTGPARPHWAGKTTLVSQIIGLAKPTSGSIRISGIDVVANPDYARQACSFQAQTQVPIAGLTATQAIELVGRVRGGAAASVRHRTKHLVDLLEIGEWADKQGETLSGGASLDLHNERRHRGLQEDDCALWIGLFQLSDVPGK